MLLSKDLGSNEKFNFFFWKIKLQSITNTVGIIDHRINYKNPFSAKQPKLIWKTDEPEYTLELTWVC